MAKTNRIYATAYDQDCTAIRLALNPETAIEIGDRRWDTGITMERCWFGRARIVCEKYSIWDDGHGRCRGTIFDVLTDPSEILQFCDKAQIDPPTWIKSENV